MTLGLFGKIPNKADFVHHNGNRPVGKDFDRWLRSGVEALRQADQDQPTSPVRFVFSSDADEILVGVFVASRDQVGRAVPLAIFDYLPAKDHASRFSLLPVAYDTFLERAAGILAGADDKDLDSLVDAMHRLPIPEAADFQEAERICKETLSGSPVLELHARVFGALSEGQHYYAYQTFVTACSEAKGKPPEKNATIVDCPVSVDVDLFTWTELAGRLLKWKGAPPSFFWIEDPQPRLLLSLGPVAGPVLALLANPEQDNSRLWPLSTTRSAAVEAAKTSLGARIDGFGDGTNAKLGQLIEALT